jgi:hypothetical protein
VLFRPHHHRCCHFGRLLHDRCGHLRTTTGSTPTCGITSCSSSAKLHRPSASRSNCKIVDCHIRIPSHACLQLRGLLRGIPQLRRIGLFLPALRRSAPSVSEVVCDSLAEGFPSSPSSPLRTRKELGTEHLNKPVRVASSRVFDLSGGRRQQAFGWESKELISRLTVINLPLMTETQRGTILWLFFMRRRFLA